MHLTVVSIYLVKVSKLNLNNNYSIARLLESFYV